MYKVIKSFLKGSKLTLVLASIILIIVDLLQLISPRIIGNIIDSLSSSSFEKEELLYLLYILLLVNVVIFITRFLMRVLVNRSGNKIEKHIRKLLFEKLLTLSSTFYLKNKTGDLMARMTNDIMALKDLIVYGMVMLIDSTLLIIITTILMVKTLSLELTILAFAPLPFMALVIILVGPLIEKRFSKYNAQFGILSEKVREFFQGVKVLKAFSKEKIIKKEFAGESKELFNKSMSFLKIDIGLNPFIVIIAFLTRIIAIFIGGTMVLNSELSLGQLVSFLAYLELLVWPFMAIGFLLNMIYQGIASFKRLYEIMSINPDITDDDADMSIEDIDGNIEFRNLSFVYDDNKIPVLKHVSFTIEKGQILGVVGKTGSGKSTIASILNRIQNPPRNTVFIDGVCIRKIPLKVLRRATGYAFQDTFIFSDTIANNISISLDKQDDILVRKYSSIVSLADDIDAMKKNYNTMLGENGVNLSGGQKQRLSLARALIKEPKIIILDDSLSAIDNKTQLKILDSLKRELKDRTTVIISHRISTLSHADKILVIEDGFITQEGKHEELVNEPGLYSELFNLQVMEEDKKEKEVETDATKEKEESK